MSPTPRAAVALVVVAFVALLVPAPVTLALLLVVAVATTVDALLARRGVRVWRATSRTLARGVPSSLTITTDESVAVTSDAGAVGDRRASRVRIRQAQPPDIVIEPSEAAGRLDAHVTAYRRGEHSLPPVAARRTGPLGFGRCNFDGKEQASLLVYPDVVAAQRLVTAMRRGRFRDPGLRTRGPLGLGTDFESIRDYLPDDDVRQINWPATARVDRPMSNVYRIEQDRDVMCLVDSGRLMTAPLAASPVGASTPASRPLPQITRLDAAVDAVTMVALVADELGDRCGVIVFDNEVRRRLAPRRKGGRAVVETILDVEPTAVDSDHDLAFRSVGRAKRALVLVFTDLVDEAAARSLMSAVPVLRRRHAVIVASVRDPDLDDAVRRAPDGTHDVYASVVAHDVLDARRRVVARLRHLGADVVEAPPAMLGEACVRSYLRLKSRARL
jgi:uncharacterized protein (DUF58 family)